MVPDATLEMYTLERDGDDYADDDDDDIEDEGSCAYWEAVLALCRCGTVCLGLHKSI